MPTKNHPNNLNMKEWLARLGYADTKDLNVIHITGTKGKGGTAALAESLLRAHFRHRSLPMKIGLYTSPHLITERERIRVNFRPLSEQIFARYFFEVWDKLAAPDGENDMPGYLQLLALLSVHAFKQEMVGVTIYEVHAGGRKDATNVFDQPVASGFTPIGLDHTDLLGPTIEKIAWHKSGIMKHGTPAFSVVQEPTARAVLEKEAAVLGCSLQFVGISGDLPEDPNLQLEVQKKNASLAIFLANAYLSRISAQLSPRDIQAGISSCSWPGRFHRIEQGVSHWYLDCAHNSLSLPIALEWFMSEVRSSIRVEPYHRQCTRILIFGHESARDSRDLIKLIGQYCHDRDFPFDSVILPPYVRYGQKVHDTLAEKHAVFWRGIPGAPPIYCVSSLRDAIDMVKRRDRQEGTEILITGSTHLVGQALALLQMSDQGS